jgi:hypothetical protein
MSAPVAFKSFHELTREQYCQKRTVPQVDGSQAVTIANTCSFETRLTWLLQFSDIGVWRWKRDLIVPLGA